MRPEMHAPSRTDAVRAPLAGADDYTPVPPAVAWDYEAQRDVATAPVAEPDETQPAVWGRDAT